MEASLRPQSKPNFVERLEQEELDEFEEQERAILQEESEHQTDDHDLDIIDEEGEEGEFDKREELEVIAEEPSG